MTWVQKIHNWCFSTVHLLSAEQCSNAWQVTRYVQEVWWSADCSMLAVQRNRLSSERTDTQSGHAGWSLRVPWSWSQDWQFGSLHKVQVERSSLMSRVLQDRMTLLNNSGECIFVIMYSMRTHVDTYGSDKYKSLLSLFVVQQKIWNFWPTTS